MRDDADEKLIDFLFYEMMADGLLCSTSQLRGSPLSLTDFGFEKMLSLK